MNPECYINESLLVLAWQDKRYGQKILSKSWQQDLTKVMKSVELSSQFQSDHGILSVCWFVIGHYFDCCAIHMFKCCTIYYTHEISRVKQPVSKWQWKSLHTAICADYLTYSDIKTRVKLTFALSTINTNWVH